MIAHLTLKKSLLPIKKGLPLNIVYNLWKPDGSIGHCLLNTVSKNSLELHLLQKRYEANLDKTEKINIQDILQKNKFITAKKVTFYKKAGSKKVAFRVPKGKAVTLKKLIYSKKKIYLQFKYGKKYGYLRVNRANYNFEKPLFQNVNSRLSG